MRKFRYFFILLLLVLASCIRNDIPYPVIVLEIMGVKGDGFICESSDIDAKNRVVTLHLDETTNIGRVPISEIVITEGGRASIPVPGEFDLRSEQTVMLSLYQDYVWTIRAEQTIERIFSVESQIGNAEFDTEHCIAKAYVPVGTDLCNIKIRQLKLGPEGITKMDPLPETLTQFETFRTVDISYHDINERWKLYIIPTDIKVEFTQTDAWSRLIWLYAQGLSNTELGFRYRRSGEEAWIEVPENKVEISGGTFKTCLTGLDPQTTYEVVAFSGGDVSPVKELTTGPELQLDNSGFEEWCEEKNIIYPGLTKDGAYWGTGNPGAAIAGSTLTDKTEDIRPGSSGRYAARLESKLAGIAGIGKLAAGNMFVGRYVATRGTNGIVGFGRPFTLRPTALHGWVKYTCGKITDVGTTQPSGVTIKEGDPDNGMVYIALGTWTPEEYGVCEKEDGNTLVGTQEVPICIDTRDKNTFFNPNSPAVIAYGELVMDKSTDGWQEFTIELKYNATDVVPTHIVLVCSASRYGDYYIGSRDSKMWIDDFELLYDK